MAEAMVPDRRGPRRRILDAALELASEGGYEALQVRALAGRAGVSSRTIYANFPSLDSLIIVAVAEQSGDLYRRFTESRLKGRSAAARVNQLISELTETMTANRALTVSLLRALLSGKPDVSQYVDGFRTVLQTMLATADRARRAEQARPRRCRNTREHLVHCPRGLGDGNRQRRVHR